MLHRICTPAFPHANELLTRKQSPGMTFLLALPRTFGEALYGALKLNDLRHLYSNQYKKPFSKIKRRSVDTTWPTGCQQDDQL